MPKFPIKNAVRIAALSAVLTSSLSAPQAKADGSKEQGPNVFNVKSYGATGNGTTNDTAAIQAAITAAGTGTGAEIFFPAGTYLFHGQLAANGVTFSGAGATLLSSNSSSFVVVSGSNTVVQNLTFATNANSGPAIESSSSTSPTIINNTFKSGFFYDITLNHTSKATVIGNTITLSQAWGINIINSIAVKVQKNIITTNSGSSNGGGIFLQDCDYDTVTENSFTGAPGVYSYGVEVYLGQTNTISKNVITAATHGIAAFETLTPNISYNNITSCSHYGILGNLSVVQIISNNTINACSIGVYNRESVGSLTIKQNTISNMGRAGITAVLGGDINIDANTISRCGLSAATAAVIEVNQPKGTYVDITNNAYKGSTTNLTYFIDVLQANATVTGNHTNTLLPNKIGP